MLASLVLVADTRLPGVVETPWHRRRLLDQLVRDHLEGLHVLLCARENNGALRACDKEGHEALRSGTENADLLVDVGEVALRGPEYLPDTVQHRTRGCEHGDGQDGAPRLEPAADRRMRTRDGQDWAPPTRAGSAEGCRTTARGTRR